MFFIRGPVVAVCLFWVASAALPGARLLSAQQPGDEVRANALRVFLDCNAFPCDDDYFRTEIGFVNWVRDRTLSQVHLIITSSQTGGGGSIYDVDFIGQEDLAGDNDSLRVTTLSTNTEDEILSALSRVIGAGLARYSAAIGQSAMFTIEPTEEGERTDELVSGVQVRDPWNFWVFELSADADFEGEDTESEKSYEGRFEATRTTEMWKFELEADGSFSRDERDLDDGRVIIDERTNWGADFLLVRSLASHWSAGVIAGAGASTRLNQEFGADAAIALEYSFFPYEEAPRRSLTARYDLRMQHYDWEEETIFFQTAETRPQHQLRVELFQRQPWGESTISIDGSQFLHDVEKWRVSLSGDLEFRVLRGLNLDIGGNIDWIEDQIFISREGLTDEEILLGRFERPTDSAYSFRVGLSYEFGSIFNNVVNNRFESRDFGGGGFDGGGGGGGGGGFE
jgi:uncharacterized membrane protein YgcG